MFNKKTVALLLIIMAVISCFCGCADKENDIHVVEKDIERDIEKEVEKAVNDYFAFLSKGFEDYEDFVADSKKFLTPDGLEIKKSEALLEEFKDIQSESASKIGNETLVKELKNYIDNTLLTHKSYEITEITADDAEAHEATVEYKCSSLEGYSVSSEFESELEELISIYTKSNYGMGYYAFENELSDLTPEQQQLAVEDLFTNLKDFICDMITEIAEDEDNYVTKKRIITLKEIDGEWLIHSDVPKNKKAINDEIDEEFIEYNSKIQKPSANLDILVSKEWEYDFDGCNYTLRMYKDGEFSNWCGCGSPAGYSDMVEYYIYDDETKILYLYDYEKMYIGQGLVEDISKDKVTIKKYGQVCKYEAVGELTEYEPSFPYTEYFVGETD